MKLLRTFACLLGLITAATIFFQFHVALPAGLINLNLADPFALLALVTLVLRTLFSKTMPQWRIPEFNRILILFGALLLLAYVIGWMKIGNTQWALSARLIGWVVLMGYLSAGYLLVAYGGEKAQRHQFEVLAITAIAVIIWTLVTRILYIYGYNVLTPTYNFEGFSGNRNAFAFQLLAVLTLSLAYSNAYVQQRVEETRAAFTVWRSWVPMGFLLAGVLWSASRAGLLAGIILLILASSTKIANRKLVIWGCFFAVLLWSATWIAQNISVIASWLGASGPSVSIPPGVSVQSAISGDDSNAERFATLAYAFKMWLNSPLVGEGLGVFIANSVAWLGHPTVIHNTPLWILAEFGLLGAVVLGWSFCKLGLYAIKVGSPDDQFSRAALLLLLLLFIVFSQFHELLYQRIFWLIIGALLAKSSPFQIEAADRTK